MYSTDSAGNSISFRCRQALVEKGIHPDELGKATNNSPVTISKYLDGTLRIPLFILAEISKLTGRQVDWLIAGQWLPAQEVDQEQPDSFELINQANNKWAEVIAQEMKEGFDLLNAIIHAVDEHCRADGLQLNTVKKGHLIIKLYDLFSEDEEKQVDKNTVAEQIKMTF